MQLKVYEIAWGETVTATGTIAGDVVSYNITFSDQGPAGPTGPQGIQGPIGLPGESAAKYRVVTSGETVPSKSKIAANTSSGSFTLTLPANPESGDVIDFYDYAESFDTNPLIIARNGKLIEGDDEDLSCNAKGAYFSLVYTGAQRGWQVLPSYGTGSSPTTDASLLTSGTLPDARLSSAVTASLGKADSSVQSVNGLTGNVTLTNMTVGAAAATHGTSHFDQDLIFNEMVKVANAGRSTVNGYYYFANDGGENDYILVGSKRLGRMVERSLKWEIEYNGTVYYRSEQKAGSTIWSPWEYTTWTVVTGSGDNPAPQVTQAHAVEVIDGLSRKIDYSGVGKLGSTSGLPVLTGADGVLETGIFGSSAGQFCEGNDARLSDSRAALPHAASHGPSGSDPVTLEDLTNQAIQNGSLNTWNDGQPYGIINTSWGGNAWTYGGSINTSSGGGSITTNGTGLIEFGEAGTRTALTGTATEDRTILLPDATGMLALVGDAPGVHAASHSYGGNDEISIAAAQITDPNSINAGTASGFFDQATAELGATMSDGNITITTNGNSGSFGVTVNTESVTANRTLTVPNATGTLALTSDITKTAVGLGNVADVDTTNAANISSGTLDNSRINWAAPSAIGSTTRNTGAFTTLTANNGTITASVPAATISQTWNASGTTFTGFLVNPTDTASAAASLLADFQTGGTSRFRVRKDGEIQFPTTGNISMIRTGQGLTLSTIGGGTVLSSSGPIQANGAVISVYDGFVFGNTTNTALLRDGADHQVAFRSGTNPQTFRLYNTFTDASNYERGFMRWSSNVLQIGTEKGGTGSARALQFQTDGTTRFTFSIGGSLFIGDGSTQANNFFGWSGNGGFRAQQTSTGVITLLNWAETDFNRLQFGGTTSSFPALKRSSTALQVRLADDSADAPLSASLFSVGSGSFDGVIVRPNAGVIGFARADGATTYIASLGFDGTTRALVANSVAFIGWSSGNPTSMASGDTRLWRDAAGVIAQYNGVNAQAYRLYNTWSSTTSFERLNIRWASNECIIDAEAGSGGGTLRGIKIGSATSSLLGFYGATPVDRPATVAYNWGADGYGGTFDDAQDVESRVAIKGIIDRLQELGLIA